MPVEDVPVDKVGPYRLVAALGEGGMGVVHRAVDDAGREVALKVVRAEYAEDLTFRRRLAREVDTMRRVRSPYVAEVLDADVAAERPYIVTRFIDGHPLDGVVRAAGPLSGGPLARVAIGLAEAVAAIHEAGVVHRDLKPNNVMMVDGAPVVIDFGIAHAADATRLTRTGLVVGTPGYLGPEILDGRPPGPAVDVYGWAATVAFAATGRAPFGGGSLEAVLARILSGNPDLDGVPPALEPLLRATLAREPEARPPAAELAGLVRALDLGAPPPIAATALGPAVDAAGPAGAPQDSRSSGGIGTPADSRSSGGTGGPAGSRASGPAGAAPDSPASGPGAAARVPEPQASPAAGPVPASPGGAPPRQAPRVALGWYKLLAYLAIVTAVAACAVVPIVGLPVVVAAVWYLRAGDSAVRSRRVPVRGAQDLVLAPFRLPGSLGRSTAALVPALLYAAVAAAVTGAALIAWTAWHDVDWPDAVIRWSAAVFAAVTLAGPGVMGPRRQAVRLLSALARSRAQAASVGLCLAGITALAVAAGWLLRPRWWPIGDRAGAIVDLTDTIAGLLHR
ncbi:serine/threonine-protein kinase [Actinoallomurus rhizosphaericola]|uniref:serine/threonine-protein kinase n=1 Tax=Actinoallomurus rhizosphaericola TaxID=2952536 RepID=UPI002091509E|nr:serine/threonine-protein kinase [Actinoallomurus rhizosphaericola]MCO5991951.1 protein kinase [Actinoallomurus rhizosphaericola]